MSQNIFQIDPIFFLPIDLEDNSKIQSEAEEEAQNSILLNNHTKKHKKNNIHKKKLLSKMIPQMKILLLGKRWTNHLI